MREKKSGLCLIEHNEKKRERRGEKRERRAERGEEKRDEQDSLVLSTREAGPRGALLSSLIFDSRQILLRPVEGSDHMR